MYNLTWHITIGKYTLAMLESVTIKRSVEALSDTAVITLPGTVYNRALEVESQIKRGDAVTIRLGYNDEPVTEFEGYLESIATDGGSLTLNCEDGLFLYRTALADKEMKNATVRDVLNHVNASVGGFSLACDYDFAYDKFVISNATGFDVLKKIQEEAKPNIYLKGTVLHVHPQYAEVFGEARYDFAVNIEKADLKYRRADERRLLVEAESKTPDGKVVKAEAGTTGGEKITLKVSGVTDTASLQKLAQEAYTQRVYTGYEGSFTAWLVPYVDAGYKVVIRDNDYPSRNGTYYVTAVETRLSREGGVRKVTIGKILS
jgi:hypothetical protein